MSAERLYRTEEEVRQARIEYCKKSSKFILTNVGLGVVVIVYTVIGAIAFMNLEQTNEKKHCIEKMNTYDKQQNESVQSLLSIAQTSKKKDEAIFFITETIETFRTNAVKIKYDNKNCTMMGVEGGPEYGWSWSGALLFCVTVYTTVGYGNITPQTFHGRLVCIIYALIGIPLMLVFLANIGGVMADVFRFVYTKACCCGCIRPKPELNSNGTSEPENPDEYADDEEEELLSVPITVTLAMVAGYIIMGAALFSAWEKWDWLKSSYYCFITITTIGFGDIVPGSTSTDSFSGQLKMIGAAVYMVFGMAIMSMAFNLIQEEMVGKFSWISDKFGLTRAVDYDNSVTAEQTTSVISDPKKRNSYMIASPVEAPYPVYKTSDSRSDSLKHMFREPSSLTNWATAAITQNSKNKTVKTFRNV
ncbi:hypothetical protein HELRODRAFT_193671 [Helobdella robusta]|uniref:Potassium channel domain-containing protein n=1 Tax=Helobdella robusta TaxID=6412 RepID=T1FV89_HELRO|nr:hypothetical protein HELRODRAFT_193671 [Helobdella robusta]ESN94958.1 hypothetical protein HELRODRAFT_193671 [Helobdella robusta]